MEHMRGGTSDGAVWDFRTAFQGSNLRRHELRKEMCRAYDKRRRRGPKLTLSRTAHDDVFALWVYAYGAIDIGLLSMVSRARELPPRHIAFAALCVVGAFCTLTFYDFFALRTIGKKHVPYRIAAMSSFASYSIGHNIGATVFTGGAIRFRIYSDYALNAIDVAKVCFLSGLTFWLGNLFVLGFGMALHPWAASSMDLLPPAINRLIALGCLGGIAAYFVWLMTGKRRQELGQNGWKVVLPSARLTLLQMLIGVVDLGFCAFAMYLLMPVEPHIDFISLAVVFILATLLGFASHAPGSLGVFDAAMLVALPEFGREQLVATLVVFRILYFLIPFSIAISIMGTRELWLNVVRPWQERRRLNDSFKPNDSFTAKTAPAP